MPTIMWVAVVGLFLTGYLVLDGASFGIGMLRSRLGADEDERRLLLNVAGPLQLGNEVWIVVVLGLVMGVFPELEAALLTGYFPVVVLVVAAMLLRDGGMWLRSQRPGARYRANWDRVITVASAALALGWGIFLGNVAEGIPTGRVTPGGIALFGPVPLLCGLAVVALTATHGALAIAWRTRGPVAERAAAMARRLLLPAGVLLALVVVVGLLAAGLEQPVGAAVAALAGLVALWVAHRLLARDRPGRATVATAFAVGLPVVAAGWGQAPAIAATAADGATLALLGGALLVMVPLMALGQVWLWRTFAGPVVPTSPQYF